MDAHPQLRDVEGCLKEADKVLKQNRFSEAVPLYEKALSMLVKLRPAGHSDITYCTQNLADSYALSQEYDKALNLFNQLLLIRQSQPGPNNTELIGCIYKIARMNEMLVYTDQARQAYEHVLDLAEKSLYVGHPLMTYILSGYILLMRDENADPEFLDEMREKLAANQSDTRSAKLVDDVVQSMHLKGFKSLAPQRPDKKKLAQEEEAKLAVQEVKKMGIRLAVFVVLLVILGVAALITMRRFSAQKTQMEQQSVSQHQNGKMYESADGLDKVTFTGLQVDSVIGGVQRRLPVEFLPKGSDFSSGLTAEAVSYKEVPQGLLEDRGKLLYSEKSRDRLVLKRMKIIADAAQKYYQQNNDQYPQTMEALISEDPQVKEDTFPGTPSDIILMDAGRDRDWNPAVATQQPAVLSTLQSDTLLKDEPPRAPGAVHCYYYSSGDADSAKCTGFFIRGCDEKGKFLPGDRPDKVFCLALEGGRASPVMGSYVARQATSNDEKIEKAKLIESK